MPNILSWNIRYSSDTKNVIRAIRQIVYDNNVDILCLQEVRLASLREGWSHLPWRLGQELGMMVAAAPHPTPSGVWWEGLVILSRFPIAKRRRKLLNYHRSLLSAELLLPSSTSLTVTSAHVSAFCTKWRQRETGQILQHTPRHSSILAGDFNLVPSDPSMQEMANAFRGDSSRDPTHGKRKIDYVFASRDLSCTYSYTLEHALSDHRAVWARIEQKPVT